MILRAMIALLALVSVARAEDPPQPLPWVRLTEFYVTDSQVRLYTNNPVYFGVNATAPYAYGPQTPLTWIPSDLKPLGVPADAKAAFLSCMMIITGYSVDFTNNPNGYVTAAPVINDLHLTFRKHNDATANVNKYLGQVAEAHRGGGVRSTGPAVWVALEDGMFDYAFWFPSGIPPWDGTMAGGASFAANCSIQMWAR